MRQEETCSRVGTLLDARERHFKSCISAALTRIIVSSAHVYEFPVVTADQARRLTDPGLVV